MKFESSFILRESRELPAAFIDGFTEAADFQHKRTGSFVARCPLCRGTNVINAGRPPGHAKSHFNRCSCSQLSGKAGQGKSARLPWSWWNPKRKSGPCGFPLTRADGSVIPVLPFAVFREFTHDDFSVKELRALAYELLNVSGQ